VVQIALDTAVVVPILIVELQGTSHVHANKKERRLKLPLRGAARTGGGKGDVAIISNRRGYKGR